MMDFTFQDSLYVRNWDVSFFPGEGVGKGKDDLVQGRCPASPVQMILGHTALVEY